MHTSGISVNQTLSTQFVECSEQKDIAYVKVEIDQDTFVKTGQGTTDAPDDLEKIFDKAREACVEKTPAYILIKADPQKWLMIFFCPDDSKVRQRMVYASSSSALREGLGGSNFLPDYNISMKSECTLSEWKRATKVIDKEDLMTREELQKEEAENDSSKSMNQVKVSAVVGVQVPITEDALAQVQTVMGAGGANTVYLDLDSKTETLSATGAASTISTDELSASLPEDMPRFIIHSFAHEHNGESKTTNMLIYYCPGKAKPKNKMFYSTAKSSVLATFAQYGEIKNIEISEAEEISSATLMADLYPNVEKKAVFKKPVSKGKGKRAFRGAKFKA